MPRAASCCREDSMRLMMSKRMRYRSSVAMAVPVACVKSRDEINVLEVERMAIVFGEVGRYSTSEEEAVMLV